MPFSKLFPRRAFEQKSSIVCFRSNQEICLNLRVFPEYRTVGDDLALLIISQSKSVDAEVSISMSYYGREKPENDTKHHGSFHELCRLLNVDSFKFYCGLEVEVHDHEYQRLLKEPHQFDILGPLHPACMSWIRPIPNLKKKKKEFRILRFCSLLFVSKRPSKFNYK